MRTLALLVLLVAVAAAQQRCGQVYKSPMTPPAAFIANQTGQAVAGGAQAAAGSWPWTVAIFQKNWLGTNDYKAAGALISDQWVVTTYSALDHGVPDSSYYVRVGSIDQTSGGTLIRVAKVVGISDENDSDHNDDIALIKLSSPVQYSDDVQPICLPNIDDDVLKPEHEAWFTSWGHTSNVSTATNSQYLVQAKMKIKENEDCEINLRAYDKFCAGGEKTSASVIAPPVSTCKDDMGGPLVQKRGDNWYLYGLSVTNNYISIDCVYPSMFNRVREFCWFFSEVAGVNCIDAY